MTAHDEIQPPAAPLAPEAARTHVQLAASAARVLQGVCSRALGCDRDAWSPEALGELGEIYLATGALETRLLRLIGQETHTRTTTP